MKPETPTLSPAQTALRLAVRAALYNRAAAAAGIVPSADPGRGVLAFDMFSEMDG